MALYSDTKAAIYAPVTVISAGGSIVGTITSPPPPPVTSFMVTESADFMITQSGDFMVTET